MVLSKDIGHYMYLFISFTLYESVKDDFSLHCDKIVSQCIGLASQSVSALAFLAERQIKFTG